MWFVVSCFTLLICWKKPEENPKVSPEYLIGMYEKKYGFENFENKKTKKEQDYYMKKRID